MKKALVTALVALAVAPFATPVAAQTKLDFILNWVPGGDHAPYYYANKMGWYAKEGLQVNLEPGKGSMLAVQKVGAGANRPDLEHRRVLTKHEDPAEPGIVGPQRFGKPIGFPERLPCRKVGKTRASVG